MRQPKHETSRIRSENIFDILIGFVLWIVLCYVFDNHLIRIRIGSVRPLLFQIDATLRRENIFASGHQSAMHEDVCLTNNYTSFIAITNK